MQKIIIDKNSKLKRIDKFLITYFNNCSKNLVYKLIRKKKIKVNGKKVDFKYQLQIGDVIQIYLSELTISKIRKEPSDYYKFNNFFINIIYEDENILIVNKPAGIIVHSDNIEKKWILQNFVIKYLIDSSQYDPSIHNFTPSPAHRIDRNTSGLVIFTKNYFSQKFINELFKKRKIKKRYIALIHGKLTTKRSIFLKIAKDEEKKQVFESQEGKESITIINPVIYSNDCTLVDVNIKTGRTHQIRKALSTIGMPIIGDSKYGKKTLNKLFNKKLKVNIKNHMLIAYILKFPEINDPDFLNLSNKTFTSVIPENFSKLTLKIFSNKFKTLYDFETFIQSYFNAINFD